MSYFPLLNLYDDDGGWDALDILCRVNVNMVLLLLLLFLVFCRNRVLCYYVTSAHCSKYCAVWLLVVVVVVVFLLHSKWIHAAMEYNQRVSKAKLLFIFNAGQNERSICVYYCWKLSTQTFKSNYSEKKDFSIQKWKWELNFLWLNVSCMKNVNEFSHPTFNSLSSICSLSLLLS